MERAEESNRHRQNWAIAGCWSPEHLTDAVLSEQELIARSRRSRRIRPFAIEVMHPGSMAGQKEPARSADTGSDRRTAVTTRQHAADERDQLADDRERKADARERVAVVRLRTPVTRPS